MRAWVVERIFAADGPLKDGSDVVSIHQTELGAEDMATILQTAESRKAEMEYVYNFYPVEMLR